MMRIKQLSPLVASQIAAGEVIERPASVLKELLENSIDAGSTTITVEIEQGGLKLIRVRDNGSGIHKEDLGLALLQHATSKISTVEDLDGISSLGFRGEALASIAAVSQLELISKPKEQDIAWEFKMDGSNIQPASHTDGTTITVKNLFYNVPARRKFLRSEHAEFTSIEELFKRLALSKFAISFSLINDGKKIKHLPACSDELAKAKRLSVLCGNRMLEQSIYLDAEQNGLRLWGWLGIPEDARSNSSNQFFYINQRMVKDKLINHAIKQAYQPHCFLGKYSTYCLYFELDVKALDVNVHPTKHEVRFRDARIIHAFLTKVITEALTKQDHPFTVPSVTSMPLKMVYNNLETALHFVADTPAVVRQESADLANITNPANIIAPNVDIVDIKILCVLGENKLILAEKEGKIFLVDVKASKDQLLANALEKSFLAHGCLLPQSLVIPKTIEFTNEKAVTEVMSYAALFAALGFNIDQIGVTNILLRAVPSPLVGLDCDFPLLFITFGKLFKELGIIIQKKTTTGLLNNIAFMKSIKIFLASVIYPEHLHIKDALQLVQDITSLPANKMAKPTFKQCNLQELCEFVYG